MKALLFTLLLLLVVISTSFATKVKPRFVNKQKVVYTVFTDIGFINIETLWDPNLRTLVIGHASQRTTEIVAPPVAGFIRLTIRGRRTRRWNFGGTAPRFQLMNLGATIAFFPPYDHRVEGITLRPGVTLIDPATVNLWHVTLSSGQSEDGSWRRRGPSNERQLNIYFVFLAVMPPNSNILDTQTETVLRERGIGAFLQQGGRSPAGQCPQLPELQQQLTAEIWTHLLSNRMLEFRPGEIQCADAPEDEDLNPVPDPNEACNPPSCPRKGPDDQDDPGAQREGKRQCRIDLNSLPEGQGTAGGSGQSKPVHVDLNNYPGDRIEVDWSAYAMGVREEHLYYEPVDHSSDGTNGIYNTGRVLGGSPFFTLWEYFKTSGEEENTSYLKRPQQIICFEALTSIRDELRR
jgi:hypothetical protein